MKISRRTLLRATGAALTLPLLPSLMGEGHAAPSGRARRFIFLFTANGQRPENWYPPDPTTWNVRDAGQFVRDAALTDYTGGMSRVFGPQFDPLLSKLILFRGLDFMARKGDGHHPPAPLSGWQADPAVTIDQILARSPIVYPDPPPVRSLHVMIKQAFESPNTVSVDHNLQGVGHQTSVAATFRQVFGELTPPGDAVAQQRLTMRLGVLDEIQAEYGVLAGHQRLGVEDRQRLAAHGDHLADLRARLSAVAVQCAEPPDPGAIDLSDNANLALATQANLDLITAAAMCDRTRVVTCMLCPGGDRRDFSHIGGPPGEHRSTSHAGPHSPAAAATLGTINNWYAQQVAALLTQLDSVVEDPTDGTTYLDNSIVYWGNEAGCNAYDSHAHSAMPVLLAGGACANFDTGRYVDYRRVSANGMGEPILYDAGGAPAEIPTDYRGRPYNALLISLLQAMGLTPADYEVAGQPGIGDYGDVYMNQYSLADAQQPLPFLTN